MNRKFLQILNITIFILTACGQSAPATQVAPVIDNATSTPSPAQTATQTSLPTATPTASITPLPTIPTFTPTFDVSTILTVTPAPKAECLNESLDDFSAKLVKEISILESPKTIDITNDGFPEVIVVGKSTGKINYGEISLYSCQSNSYLLLEKFVGLFDIPTLANIQDLNQNGIPEIVTAVRGCGGFGACWEISILEWDGEAFQHLESKRMNENRVPSLEKISFEDLDNNKTIELIVERGLPSHPDKLSDGPSRRFTEIFSWNGGSYTLTDRKIASPQFAFQAIQDGDQETLNQNFDNAFSLYEEVISSKSLEWWSLDRFLYYRNNLWAIDTLEPTPTPDFAEYPRLATYAYYRIMLIHLVQNHESDATTVYNTLQEKFGNDQYGHPYVEMGTAFWEAYQSAHKMYDGCAAAIQYAAEHPEILIPLGSDYHGSQSHIYVAEDVCPFR